MDNAQNSDEQRFELLYRTTQAFNSSLNINQIFDRVIDEVIAAIGAERGFVVVRQPNGELLFQVARGVDGSPLDPEKVQVSTSIIDEVIDRREPLISQDALSDHRFSEHGSVVDLKLKSILCVPFKCKGNLRGAIYVENRIQAGIFTEKELDLLVAIAANASVAIDNAQNFLEVQEQLLTLNLLYEISADLSSRLDLDQLLTATLQRVQEALEAPAASLMTVEEAHLVFQVALGDKSDRIKPFRIPLTEGIAGWVVRNRQGVIVNNTQLDDRFYQGADTQTGFVTESIIAAPLLTKNEAIGVIELFNKPGGFSDNDLELLTAIASNAAIAIENARLYQAAVEKGRMERELQMALSVQTGLLPDQLPEWPGWDFAAHWHPARQVSGDFYDFVHQDGTGHTIYNANPTLGMLIADVTDKGMPAALFMAFTRSILRASLHQVASPAAGITQANHLICEESSRGLFVTMFYAQISSATGELTYVNAGHNPPLLYQAANDRFTRLMPTGIPVGIAEDFKYQQERVSLAAGDFIVCYTDGVTEAIDAKKQEFGMDRLEALLRQYKQGSAEEIAAAVEQAVTDFSPPGSLFDDTTILVVKRDSAA